MGNLPFGALKALDNMVIGGGGKVTVAPCETILVNGVCPLPCKPNDPLCVDDPLPPPVVVDPTDPTSAADHHYRRRRRFGPRRRH